MDQLPLVMYNPRRDSLMVSPRIWDAGIDPMDVVPLLRALSAPALRNTLHEWTPALDEENENLRRFEETDE